MGRSLPVPWKAEAEEINAPAPINFRPDLTAMGEFLNSILDFIADLASSLVDLCPSWLRKEDQSSGPGESKFEALGAGVVWTSVVAVCSLLMCGVIYFLTQ